VAVPVELHGRAGVELLALLNRQPQRRTAVLEPASNDCTPPFHSHIFTTHLVNPPTTSAFRCPAVCRHAEALDKAVRVLAFTALTHSSHFR
jgi:hypothetical protein